MVFAFRVRDLNNGSGLIKTTLSVFREDGIGVEFLFSIKPPGDRRFWSMLPFTKVPFWVPIFDPQPHGDATPFWLVKGSVAAHQLLKGATSLRTQMLLGSDCCAGQIREKDAEAALS